jgi:superfamily II DNA or RNA helicase/HKD family nuclease
MPRIFDNLEHKLLDALIPTLATAYRADFCVGFFNLRGWRLLAEQIERFQGGDGYACRVLIGMHATPDAELRAALRVLEHDDGLDLQRAAQLKRQVAEQFRAQLTAGVPNNQDELALQQLARQLRAGKVAVKLHLRYNLHAKLYLLFRDDYNNPVTGYMGSSNLTMAGLRQQGELNIDVLDHAATGQLQHWFDARWDDTWALDISAELASIIEESWARPALIAPYLIYLKMVYHLSQEARAGISEFALPRDFRGKLFPFQEAAVKIAARYLNKQGGVLLGDVVGLGKTMMATALARIFKDDHGWRPLIICPRNLVSMWQAYNLDWDMGAEIVPLSQVQGRLPQLTRRFRLVVIDESHTLRNRESKRYKAIYDYIHEFDCKVILLSATPYNKEYRDLGAQLRLFLPEDRDLGMRPEALIRKIGETSFFKLQVPPRSLRAFEKSAEADDWRELMRLFLVRRTRSFIKDNYAERDPANDRFFLRLPNDTRFYFPQRVPRTIQLPPAEDGADPYSLLYGSDVVDAIAGLSLPRYGLANYLKKDAQTLAEPQEQPVLDNLSRAGKRLMGFSRTNLFKRLESSGAVFVQSLHRHVLRNYVFAYAISNQLPLPLGTQGADVLDLDSDLDAESDALEQTLLIEETAVDAAGPLDATTAPEILSSAWYAARAAEVYRVYSGQLNRRFTWLRPVVFTPRLKRDLLADAEALLALLQAHAPWIPTRDAKLDRLLALLRTHSAEKVLVFTQFADTVSYIVEQAQRAGIPGVAAVTGQSANPTELAHRFSPRSNNVTDPVLLAHEVRVLVSTDVLSEGQNLQDCHLVVNYDLPWAIIRLIQRAGRVDRIGQDAPEIICYTFLPADGIERILQLRARVRRRLHENREVVGTDEQFFDDPTEAQVLRNLYTETAGVLDDDADADVDLASAAYQVWRNATGANTALKQQVEALPNVVYSARSIHDATATLHTGTGQPVPPGALVYLRTAQGNDALAWIDSHGENVTQSQAAILRAAECTIQTGALPRPPQHHQLVQQAITSVEQSETLIGGLGSSRAARFRTYEVLKRYHAHLQATEPLYVPERLTRAIDDVYKYPLKQGAIDTLNRQLRSGVADADLAELVMTLRDHEQLSVIHALDSSEGEPQIVCSLGLV